MRRLVLLTSVIALSTTPLPHAAEITVVGAWTLKRDLTTMPEAGDERRAPEGGRRGGGAGGRGGGRGGGVGGGIGRGGLGGFGGGNAPNEDDMRDVEVIRRRLAEIPRQLTITRNADSVTIVDEIGRSYTLKTDGKKQDRVSGDGEFTSKTRFDGARLVIEDDFGGPKLITTYIPVLEGGEIPRLEVTLKAENMPGAARERLAARGGRRGSPEIRRVYDAAAR